MKRENHPIKEIMQEAIEKINKSIDVNKVIGAPIISGEDVIIPISKVSVGFVAGGGEYNQEIPPKNSEKEYPFAGGSGAGFSVAPIGFIVSNKKGTKYLDINGTNFDKVIDIFNNLSESLNKKESQ